MSACKVTEWHDAFTALLQLSLITLYICSEATKLLVAALYCCNERLRQEFCQSIAIALYASLPGKQGWSSHVLTLCWKAL